MKKLIAVFAIVGVVGVFSVPPKAHASLGWYLIGTMMGQSSGESSGRAMQKSDDALTIVNLNSTINLLQNDLNSCQSKLPKINKVIKK